MEAETSEVSFNFTSSLTYFHFSVKPLLVLCNAFTTFKSIRVAQWISETAFFACGDEFVRQITDVFDKRYLTGDFKIHSCFLKYLVGPFSK